MTSLRSVVQGAVDPRRPGLRRLNGRRSVILAALAILLVSQTGCQSGFLGACGGRPCFSGLRNFRERVFPRPIATGCCGAELGAEAAPLVYGNANPGMIVPGGTVTTPGSSAVDPGSVETPGSTLDPIPQAAPGSPPATSGTGTGAKTSTGNTSNKAVYEAKRPRFDRQGGVSTLARSLTSSPESTQRSARGSSASASAPASNNNDSNPLDNLPPVYLPLEATPANVTQTPNDSNEPKPTAAPGPAPAAETLGDGPAPSPTLPNSLITEMTASPGIKHIAGVDSNLAGGSLPDANGLDWLVERGYKTILDLREPSEVPATFAPEVAKRGLLYRSLPISLTTVDPDHVNKFYGELANAGARPLYFFDTDGNRAGLLWYVRRISVDKVDSQVAKDDAMELGLTDAQWLKAADDYLAKLKTAANGTAPTEPKS